jgi:TonB family protein
MRRYFLQSAALHFSVIALLFFAGFFRSAPKLIMIDGVDFMGGGGGGGKTNTSGPKKEQMGQVVPTPVKTVIPQKPAPIQKETIAKETWNVKKPEQPLPKKEQKDVEHADKKQQETTNIIRRGVAPETKPGVGGFDFGDGPQGQAIGVGLGSGEGSGFAGFGSYLKVLRSRIWSEWSQSSVIGSNEMCIVGLTVARNGDVTDIKVEKASSNPFYDNVALRAVRNASPLPPLPSSFSSDSQRFRIQFRLVE